MASDSRFGQLVSRRGLHYVRDGTGPAVLLVHGWCLSRRVWMYLEYGLIQSGHCVITPDLAGFGKSDSLDPRATLEEHAEDLVDLLDELDLEEATLVGFAFGAGVILSAPDYRRARALVSLAVPSASTAPYPRMRGAILKDWPGFASRSAEAILSQPASPETKDWLGRIFEGTTIKAAISGLNILAEFDPTALAQRWKVPAYFVHGAEDPIVPPLVSRQCAELFGGEYVEIGASGHLVVIDQKQAVLDLVQRVVAGQSTVRQG
jgi:non-heme chloroperoxidase